MKLTKKILATYFLNTSANWKYRGEMKNDDVFYWTGSHKHLKGVKNFDGMKWILKKIYKTENIELNYDSFNDFYKTGSFYFLIDNKKLVRISDHWTDSNSNNINKVGLIKSCNWFLKVNKKDLKNVVGKEKRHQKYNYQIAELQTIKSM